MPTEKSTTTGKQNPQLAPTADPSVDPSSQQGTDVPANPDPINSNPDPVNRTPATSQPSKVDRTARAPVQGTRLRTKFKLDSKTPTGGVDTYTLVLNPVPTESDENRTFFKGTAGGRIELNSVSADSAKDLRRGQSFYVDLIPLDPTTPPEDQNKAANASAPQQPAQ